ncbi:HNH endonuclease signature motif containing protein [Corynebacterium fournieri]|uniref:HNH endonuclease signature motif containing protein n=1 Tax=Corynebacterium fournieri TaxID=1852390 RepID=UPI000A2F79BB|nr:HNH endonuclease signature motif containing protein [Corynebacterium fournieri]WJY97134.1 hypothetical protein CFOUR_03525 [Corynebacterium fournieri]
MNPFDAFIQAMAAESMETLRHFDLPVALAAGIAPDKAHAWARMQDVYYGKTKFTRKQALAARKARGFSLDELGLIERRVGGVKDAGERWRLRLELLDVTGGYKAIERAARELIPREDNAPAKKQVAFSQPNNGRARITIDTTDRNAADLEHRLRQHIDPALPAAAQMEEEFWRILDGTTGGVVAAAPRPIVMVPIDAHARILAGDGDDVVLTLTDGTTMTGAEYLEYEFGDALEVAAFHPEHGAVNLYDTERFANQKQRDLACMVSPVCAFPGCRHGALGCEIHHVHAWKHGGLTNMNNLVPLCRYHNRINDDDPWRRKRGHITMIRGAPWWISPRGYHIKNTDRGALDQLFGPQNT